MKNGPTAAVVRVILAGLPRCYKLRTIVVSAENEIQPAIWRVFAVLTADRARWRSLVASGFVA